MVINRTTQPATNTLQKKNTALFTMGPVATLDGGLLQGFSLCPSSRLICSYNDDGVISVIGILVLVTTSFGINAAHFIIKKESSHNFDITFCKCLSLLLQ